MAVRTRIEDGEGSVGGIAEIKLDDNGRLTENAVTALVGMLKALSMRLNGALTLGNATTGHRTGNFDGQWITVLTPPTANQEFAIPHGLGRTPVAYVATEKDKAADLYTSSKGSWDSEVFYLKCSATSATITIWLS